ncbi:Transmembrane GTPase fzo1 [Tolypocladium paradoxum]|uniref:Transmembrane GTPase fzo1 n=1 Tax=Tolypocladium paradoxum TaxID=94208 RepID=A0A2S4L1N9_9HYPO|nr:Transmembrane GTPase fzo1 [Tolypocladium paradoxum]
MSQDHSIDKGKSPIPTDRDKLRRDEFKKPRPFSRPHYVTVGSGSTAAHAASLQALLDSGYGSSTAGDDEAIAAAADMATQPDLPLLSQSHPRSDSTPEGRRRTQAGAIQQLWYDRHRAALGRSIERAINLLRSLQQMNVTWNAYYPSLHGAEANFPETPNSSPNFGARAQSAILPGSPTMSPAAPPPIRRSETSYQDHANAESSRMGERRVESVPRLLTPQVARSPLAVLNLDLRLGHLHQAELIHTLERSSVASLLDGKICSAVRHLQSLRERMEDISSKVLVTGDVNAGKSTFCNALLGRKILPEDQQPCTAIFCEVVDARENEGVEEVHAVHLESIYNRHDEQTYDTYTLEHLAGIVSDTTKYKQCRVYVKDARPASQQSLLNNGAVQITLIDAPGLNSHTTKTTAVFARQEEIDVVVFVVSASNHFTISAQDFITAAAAEKAYLFMVVNGFDTIKDKERCRKMILAQLLGLSPRTFKESSEFVHFVCSRAVPTGGYPLGGGLEECSRSSGGGGGDDPKDDPKGKEKDVESIRDFERLEESLRKFVLEKRARSKLAPAKHYLFNILNDINVLAMANCEVAQLELDKGIQALQELEPQLKSRKEAEDEVNNKTENIMEGTCQEVYNHTRSTLTTAITDAGDNRDHGVLYPGLFSAFHYSEDLKQAILTQIAASVTSCEEYARASTVRGVNMVKKLGLLHLGNEYENLTFRPATMFRRKKDELARQIDVPTELLDFVDWPVLFEGESITDMTTALKVATAVGGGWIGFHKWMDQAFVATKVMGKVNLRRLFFPAIIVTALIAMTCMVRRIPSVLPRRLSTKIACKLAEIDYVHANATRISGSVRKVLGIPANNIRVDLDRLVKELGERRDESLRVRAQSTVALTYFRNLVQDSAQQKTMLEGLDLEAPT